MQVGLWDGTCNDGAETRFNGGLPQYGYRPLPQDCEQKYEHGDECRHEEVGSNGHCWIGYRNLGKDLNNISNESSWRVGCEGTGTEQ